MFRSENPVIVITTYADTGVSAYDVSGERPRALYVRDVQDGQSREELLPELVEAVQAHLQETVA